MAVTINLNNVQGAATARTAAQWVTDNPIIPANYVGFETDTGKYKLGDGVTAWNSLSYPAFGGGGGGGVPYTGATQSLDMGEFGVDAGFYQYDLTPTNTPTTQGTAYWDDSAETVALIMNGVVQKIGEDTFFHVKNSTGSNIAAGVAVRFAGTDGNSGKVLIAPFLADGTYPSAYFMGVAAEAIANGSEGKVYQFGKMKQINTSAYQNGDILYASSTVAGGYQTTAPAAPNNVISVAAVINAANNGSLMIKPVIEDVKFANLRGNVTDNAALQTALDAKQNTLTNPVTGTGANGQVSFWNGTNSQTGDNGLFWDNTNKRLGIGTNAPNTALHVSGSTTASSLLARGANLTPTLVAAANNDVLVGLDVNPTFTNGAFTGVGNITARFSSTRGNIIIESTTNGQNSAVQLNVRATNGAISGAGFYNLPGSTISDNRFVISADATNIHFNIFRNGNVLIQNGGTFTDAGAKLQLQTGAVGTIGQIITAAAGQTANLLQLRNSAAAVMTHFTANGAWSPASLADANAANSTVYYSTTQSKLVFKDSAGVVNDLY